MKVTRVFTAAALFTSALAAGNSAFASGGNLPASHVAYGNKDEINAQYVKRRVSKRAGASNTTTTSSTTSRAVADASCTHGPTSRNCWGDGYSGKHIVLGEHRASTDMIPVDTDFDAKWPTTGVTRYYTLTLSNTTCNPDGGSKGRPCLVFNGAQPGRNPYYR
jgi:hypothetical protein